jgi:D-alanine-D-alanine ligase
VLNLCDEGFNNDAFKELHVPALLEMLDIPYSGAGPASLGLCYSKALVRAIAETLEVPTPLETYLDPDDQSATLPSIFPALVKPNFGDSSLGITQEAVVETPEQLVLYLEQLRRTLPGRPALVQEFLDGPEYSVGIIGNPGQGYQMLPVLEVDYSGLAPELPRILGYESKWYPDSPYWTDVKYMEARLDGDTRRMLYDWSGLLFERLACRDYARFDFRTDREGTIKLLEVNPNPGWCWDGKFNMMAGFADLRYAEMLGAVLRVAQYRELTARTGQPAAAEQVFGGCEPLVLQ